MKKLILSMALATFTVVACKNEKNKVEVKEEVKEVEKAEEVNSSYKVDVSKSVVNWKGSKPTGTHNGAVLIKNGFFNIENNTLKTGEFTIDMNTISCADLQAENGKEKLESHLKSVDFFDVDKFSTASFKIVSSEENEGKINVTGNLTLKDITKSITIPMTVTENDGVATLKSDTFSIDRTDFGITYSSKKFDAALKDKFINDLMEMSIEIEALK